MTCIIPAIIPTSFEHLTSSVESLTGLSEIHLDVVDGQFVPFSSWPYQPRGIVSEAKDILAPFSVEVDLMVKDPLSAAADWLALGVEMLVFHVEAISPEAFSSVVAATDRTIGISALNGTPYEKLKPYLALADYVQVMGIANIGAQGQSFDERVYDRIAKIRHDFPTLPISIDGSVNQKTISAISVHRPHRYIVGSAIMGAASPVRAQQDLQELLNHSEAQHN